VIGEGGVYVFLFPLFGAYICLYFLWHLVIHPVLGFWVDREEEKKLTDAKYMTRRELGPKESRTIRDLLPDLAPKQRRELIKALERRRL